MTKTTKQINNQSPIHIQVREQIREQIEEGVYQPGDEMPSEIQLAKEYGINRLTAVSYTHLYHLLEYMIYTKKRFINRSSLLKIKSYMAFIFKKEKIYLFFKI